MQSGLQATQVLQVQLSHAVLAVKGGCLGIGEVFEDAACGVLTEETIGLGSVGSTRVGYSSAGEVDVVLGMSSPVCTDYQIHLVIYSNNDDL